MLSPSKSGASNSSLLIVFLTFVVGFWGTLLAGSFGGEAGDVASPGSGGSFLRGARATIGWEVLKGFFWAMLVMVVVGV